MMKYEHSAVARSRISSSANNSAAHPVRNSTLRVRHSIFETTLLAIALTCLASPIRAEDNPSAKRLFTLRVLPLLKEKCLGCHGEKADDIKGEFDVRSREALLKGGESEAASIIPGNPEESPFYQAVMWDGLEMPPKENDRLTKKQTAYIRTWIKAGAPWPDDAAQAAECLASARTTKPQPLSWKASTRCRLPGEKWAAWSS